MADPIDLEALREFCALADEPPFSISGKSKSKPHLFCIRRRDGEVFAASMTEANARYAMRLLNAAPALLDEVSRLRAEAAEMERDASVLRRALEESGRAERAGDWARCEMRLGLEAIRHGGKTGLAGEHLGRLTCGECGALHRTTEDDDDGEPTVSLAAVSCSHGVDVDEPCGECQ